MGGCGCGCVCGGWRVCGRARVRPVCVPRKLKCAGACVPAGAGAGARVRVRGCVCGCVRSEN